MGKKSNPAPTPEEIAADLMPDVSTAEAAPVELTFADVMRIHRELRAKGLTPPEPVLEKKKRAKLKRF